MARTAAVWRELATFLQHTKEQLQEDGWDEDVVSKLAENGYITVNLFKRATRLSLRDIGIPPALVDYVLSMQDRVVLTPPVGAAPAADNTSATLRSFLPLGPVPALSELPRLCQQGLTSNGSRVLLPVPTWMYLKLTQESQEWARWVQDVAHTDAHVLAHHVGSVIMKRVSQPGSELVMPGLVDELLYGTMQLLTEQLGTWSLKRYRNQTEHSLTQRLLRPDFWLLAANTMMCKGEDKTEEQELGAAREDLLSKMSDWSPAYHGTIDYLLCYAAAGLNLEFCAIPRSVPGEKISLVNLSGTLNLRHGFDRMKALHTAMWMYCIITEQVKLMFAEQST